MPPLAECLVVVTGLPRSGTSMVMQMLAAGGVRVLTDGLRAADEDNPRGYQEFEPVKNLLNDSAWLLEGRGKAVKSRGAVIDALPAALPCRVILSERNLDEVLDSQERMLNAGISRRKRRWSAGRILRRIAACAGPRASDAGAAGGNSTAGHRAP